MCEGQEVGKVKGWTGQSMLLLEKLRQESDMIRFMLLKVYSACIMENRKNMGWDWAQEQKWGDW